jgi:hypothetical protein
MIILSWIFWGLIAVVPFLGLGLETSAKAITILFIATNIFWPGVLLTGKELVEKYRLRSRLKTLLNKKKEKIT